MEIIELTVDGKQIRLDLEKYPMLKAIYKEGGCRAYSIAVY